MSPTSLVWFREDLRVADNRALNAAVESGLPVLCLFVFETGAAGHNANGRALGRAPGRAPGGASRWWLHGSLTALRDSLHALGAELMVLSGSAEEIIPAVVEEAGVSAVFWNRRYGPERHLDAALKSRFRGEGRIVRSFPGRLLFEPGEVTTKSGELYKVFTPYRNATLLRASPPPLPAPTRLSSTSLASASWPHSLKVRSVPIPDLRLEPSGPDWAAGFRDLWQRGERGAHARLSVFLRNDFAGYAATRNRPDLETTSRLSPHLHFGEISPGQVISAAREALDSRECGAGGEDFDVLRSEIGWRDFSHQLLFAHEDISAANIQSNFDAFPWRDDPAGVEAWKAGATGYPFVDAGMRQLWATGFMHNRVRMVAASFLIKHLLVDWRVGERWFWDTLVDADAASNAASWQWVAGSGADAAPYYRIFNPVVQGERFDPEGDYVRRWVPELSRMPRATIHRPWEASAAILEAAGVRPGTDYPMPIVDHDTARRRALSAFESLKRPAS